MNVIYSVARFVVFNIRCPTVATALSEFHKFYKSFPVAIESLFHECP
jgi:hypothetical protein